MDTNYRSTNTGIPPESQENERSLLLSLSKRIAMTRGENELKEAICQYLKDLIPLNNMVIVLINEDKQSYRTFLTLSTSPEQGRNPLNDGIVDTLIHSGVPRSWEIAEIMAWHNAPKYIRSWARIGAKQMAGIAFRFREENIGCLLVCSEKGDTFQKEELKLLQTVSTILSIGIANVVAEQEIAEREKEKELLLSISNDIALIRDKKALLRVIQRHLKSFFNINDVEIRLLNREKETHSIYMIVMADARTSHPDYESILRYQSTMYDGIFDKALQATGPVINNIEKLTRSESAPIYLKFLKQTGIRETVVVALRNGNEDIGTFTLFAEETDTFSHGKLSLVSGIAHPVSLAVANILANDELIKREKEKVLLLRSKEEEKEQLLSLSNTIATVRDKKDLSNVLDVKLRQVIPFVDILITAFDHFLNRHRPYIYLVGDKRIAHFDFSQILKTADPQNDPVIKTTMAAMSPVLFDLEALAKDPASPECVTYCASIGRKQLLGIALRNGDIDLGCLFIFFEDMNQYQDKHFSSIQGISSQLSIALANILANDELLQREEDKSALLSISTTITAVRTKKDLLGLIDQRIKTFFSFEEFLIFLTNEDKKTYSVFLYDQDGVLGREATPSELMKESFKLSDCICDPLLKSPIPITFDLDELLIHRHLPRYVRIWQEDRIKKMIGIPLHIGGQPIGGVLVGLEKSIAFTENRLSLFQAVGVQISAGIANILANEKIEKQLMEISQYKQRLQDENQYLQQEIETVYNYSDIVGESEEMRKVFYLITQVAETESSVLILGETGTGKELIARAIHNSSNRKEKLMIKVNCATLPANLIESELFGHERGSFTGATDRRIGKFELAHRGTLFLDEIGELPLELQVKLLRALQEKEIERVGGRSIIKVDVRIIAATNRDLNKEVQAGRFRSDLFYRLDVFPITLPPLRDRKEDIPALASHFIAKHSRLSGRKVTGLSRNALKELMSYDWPGNVRELEHLIERTVLLTSGITINQVLLPATTPADADAEERIGKIKTIDEVEREHIMLVLKKCKGKVAGPGGAAEILKVPSTTLNSKIKRLGITKEYITPKKV